MALSELSQSLKRTPSIRGLLLVLALVLLSGCVTPTLSPKNAARDFDLPTAWAMAADSHRGPVVGGWVKTLGNSKLEEMIREAMTHNRDLRAAAARLRAVKQGVIVARANRLPGIGGGLSGARSESAVRDGQGKLDSFQGADDYRLTLNLSWEVDLWGRLANLHRAAEADLESEQADFRGAQLSLAAQVAKAWCGLATAQAQVNLAEQTRESFERNLRIVERNYKAGDVSSSPLDVQFARTQLASTERGLIAQKLGLAEARRSLEVMLGRYPAGKVDGAEEVPTPVGTVPAGLPSELLMRRPDLRAAAASLRASSERADASQKNLLPSISLTAGGNAASSRDLLDVIAEPASIARSVAASLAQPIFRGGALQAEARQSLELREAAVQSFAQSVLRAFREIESALNAERLLAEQHAFLETEVRQANLAEKQASRDYSEGIVGYLSVLEAQRRAFNARSAMISLRNDRLQTRIDLHLALGGDFDDTLKNS